MVQNAELLLNWVALGLIKQWFFSFFGSQNRRTYCSLLFIIRGLSLITSISKQVLECYPLLTISAVYSPLALTYLQGLSPNTCFTKFLHTLDLLPLSSIFDLCVGLSTGNAFLNMSLTTASFLSLVFILFYCLVYYLLHVSPISLSSRKDDSSLGVLCFCICVSGHQRWT